MCSMVWIVDSYDDFMLHYDRVCSSTMALLSFQVMAKPFSSQPRYGLNIKFMKEELANIDAIQLRIMEYSGEKVIAIYNNLLILIQPENLMFRDKWAMGTQQLDRPLCVTRV